MHSWEDSLAARCSQLCCADVFLFEPVGALISTVISQMILGSRVYAVRLSYSTEPKTCWALIYQIYGQSKPIAGVLSAILVAEIVIGGISISTTSPRPPVPGPPSAQPPCGALMGPFGWLIAFWVCFLTPNWNQYSYWLLDNPAAVR